MRRSDGTLQQRREQLPWPADRPFRILSIDGGGILGVLPASVLARLEAESLNGQPIGDYFDLIAGTSTGGIIALALSLGMTAARIQKLYIDHGAELFPPMGKRFRRTRGWLRFAAGTMRYRYERGALEYRLSQVFQNATIGDAQRRLCIPSFDGFTEVNIFKTPHHPDYKKDWVEQMVKVALATAAAPTYFPIYKDGERYFGDGGVWANNPTMVALVDALACYQVERRQIHILSLGCGEVDLRLTKGQIARGGLFHWRKIIASAMQLQSQNALGQAGLLVGRDHLLRVTASPRAGEALEMDDYEGACTLVEVGNRLADTNKQEIQKRFLTEISPVYPAYYGSRALAANNIL